MISSKLFEKYFGYSSPSDMYKILNETRNLEENKANADIFENNLVYLTKNIKNSSKDGVDKTEEINWVKDIVQFILHLNEKI